MTGLKGQTPIHDTNGFSFATFIRTTGHYSFYIIIITRDHSGQLWKQAKHLKVTGPEKSGNK